jgi:phage terminase large subunit-like protein
MPKAPKRGLTRGERVCAFIEAFCRVPEGAHVGKPLKLAPFQREFILAVFDNPAVTRRAYLSIARKNAKSATIACILLAFLVGPEAKQNSQIISGAMSREQAALVFKLAQKMVNLNPALRAIVRDVPSSKTLHGLTMNVEYRAIAAEGSTAHGLSPVLAILDEVGQIRGPQSDFVEAIETGQGAHDNPLLIAISTQAPSDADLFSIWLDDAERSGDPTIVCRVYAADKDAELTDPKAWAAANPALGLFRSLADVETQAAEAVRMPSKENGFRNLTLNQRVTRHTPFVSPLIWKACAGPVDESAFYEGPVYGGLDLSLTTDLTALVLIAQKDGVWHIKPVFWTPESTLADRSKKDRTPYDAWVRDGFMKATPGPAVEYDFVARDIAAITEGMDVRKIGFDRHRMKTLEGELNRIDVVLPFEAFGQGFVSMAPAVDRCEIEFLHHRFRHGGHPVMTMCAANAILVPDAAGNRKMDKSKSTGRIDGMVSLAMAVGVMALDLMEAEPASPWDDPNFSLEAA